MSDKYIRKSKEELERDNEHVRKYIDSIQQGKYDDLDARNGRGLTAEQAKAWRNDMVNLLGCTVATDTYVPGTPNQQVTAESIYNKLMATDEGYVIFMTPDKSTGFRKKNIQDDPKQMIILAITEVLSQCPDDDGLFIVYRL